MVDEYVLNVVEQLTLRKIGYARRLLESVNLPYSGIRSKVRERLVEALERNLISVPSIQALLDEALPADLEVARQALDRITSRGYERGKQLSQEFERLVRDRRQ